MRVDRVNDISKKFEMIRTASRGSVAASSHGQITGYFAEPDEYEEFKRFQESRGSFATAELSEEKVKAIGASRMDARHKHLDRVLKSK